MLTPVSLSIFNEASWSSFAFPSDRNFKYVLSEISSVSSDHPVFDGEGYRFDNNSLGCAFIHRQLLELGAFLELRVKGVS